MYRHDGSGEDKRQGSSRSDSNKFEPLGLTQRIEKKLAKHNASQNVCKRWLFEGLSWLTSAVCIGAMITIYTFLENKPLSVRGADHLLTLVNILGKVASAALVIPTSEALGQLKWNWFLDSRAMWDFEIFDKATRGPLGALLLLFRTKCRSLAALGALLIVLLLAIDSFFQQVVESPSRWTKTATQSHVPKVTWYEPPSQNIYREGVEAADSLRDIKIVLDQFAYGNGTQPVPLGNGNGSRPDIPMFCPTSNCDWPVYKTLGVCSQCEDISAHLTYACLNTTFDWSVDIKGGFGVKYPTSFQCGYFLNVTSQNPVLMSGYVTNSNGTIQETLLNRLLPLTTLFEKEPLYGNGSINFKGLRNTIADFVTASAINGSEKSVHQHRPPMAQECVLTWCVKTLRSAYFWDTYMEEVLDAEVNVTQGRSPWLAVPFQTELENGTDIFYTDDINIDTKDGNRYGTSNQTALMMQHTFIDMLPSFTVWDADSKSAWMRFKTWSEGAAWQRKLDFNPWLTPNNVTKHMERLATAMTNAIRSGPNITLSKGHSYDQETYIKVRWPWIVFPLIMLVLSLLFLVMTIIKTSSDGTTGIWKNSAMPTLLHALSSESQGQFTSFDTLDGVQKTERNTRIKLLPNVGWRMSSHR